MIEKFAVEREMKVGDKKHHPLLTILLFFFFFSLHNQIHQRRLPHLVQTKRFSVVDCYFIIPSCRKSRNKQKKIFIPIAHHIRRSKNVMIFSSVDASRRLSQNDTIWKTVSTSRFAPASLVYDAESFGFFSLFFIFRFFAFLFSTNVRVFPPFYFSILEKLRNNENARQTLEENEKERRKEVKISEKERTRK